MIRVSQQALYNSFMYNMNYNLSSLIELNQQASSQKRINKPSDDPTGAYRVLEHREALDSFDQYQRNIDSAQGWLEMADDTLLQVSEIMTRLREIAEQGATGTLTADNREQISNEARQLYEQLIMLSNVEYEGKSIFAGHKVEDTAFTQAQWVDAHDASLQDGLGNDLQFNVTGGTAETVYVRFTGPWFGVGTSYEFSKDGGETWDTTKAVSQDAVTNEWVVDLDGTKVVIEPPPAGPPNIVAGSTWTVYPTARYNGDDNDAVEVDEFGAGGITGTAAGTYKQNVQVRIDGYDAPGQQITYSTSTDGGQTWVTDNTAPAAPGATTAQLSVPGGTLSLAMPTDVGTDLAAGQQFSIRPRMADIAMEISPDEDVIVNSVGKDVFGGIYLDPANTYDALSSGATQSQNMFDTVGRLVASLETNSQEGCANALEDLRTSTEHILNYTAEVAGRENRLSVASNVLVNMELNETSRLSSVEDVDVAELMTSLAQQQTAYQAVLTTTSQILQLSLVNYM